MHACDINPPNCFQQCHYSDSYTYTESQLWGMQDDCLAMYLEQVNNDKADDSAEAELYLLLYIDI